MLDMTKDNKNISLLETADVFAFLRTSHAGLTSVEANKRLLQYGKNKLPKTVVPSVFWLLLRQMTHFMALLLWAAGALAFLAGMPQLGWATWAVVVINGLFSFWQEYRADQALLRIMDLLPRQVKVYRDGRTVTTGAEDVVVGDVLLLEAGDHVPADARVVEAEAAYSDLSMLTGESMPVERVSTASAESRQSLIQSPNLVFAGTTLVAGRAIAAIYAIGRQTELGTVSRLTAKVVREKSTLELQVQHIVRVITMIALLMGLAVFILAVGLLNLDFQAGFLFAIGIVVANVPEGLLPTVSLTLAVGVQRMAKQNALVRRLSALETLGATTLICTDKTGTLTKNEVTVKKIWVPDCETEVTGSGYERTGEVLIPCEENRKQTEILLTVAVICSEADIGIASPVIDEWEITGDPTEASLLIGAAKYGWNIASIRAGFSRLNTKPFDSHRKTMSVAVQCETGELLTKGAIFVFAKGAPVELLQDCRFVLKKDGVFAMTPQERQEAVVQNDRLSGQGHRVLAFAYREAGKGEDFAEKDLIFIGFMAMVDPLRPEVTESIRLCQEAGIKVTIITGDYGLTGEAIGRQIGLVKERANIITGQQLEMISQTQLQILLQDERPIIFARANPEHKLKIVEAYQANGQIVAVTGDGVNDAPALKAANIGVAMGKSGTDVAREVADIVLLDDNFATIVKAIEEGRAINDNIRKFMTYIFASNIPEIVPFLAVLFLGIPPALTILQILAIDVGTDMLPALALGAEPPEKGILRRSPLSYQKKLLDRSLLLRAYGFIGVIEAAVSMAAFLLVWYSCGFTLLDMQTELPRLLRGTADVFTTHIYQHATTMALASIVACQIGNLFVCRSEHLPFWEFSLWRNPFLLAGIGYELAILASITNIPFLAAIFLTQPISFMEWGMLVFCPLILLVLEELRRHLVSLEKFNAH